MNEFTISELLYLSDLVSSESEKLSRSYSCSFDSVCNSALLLSLQMKIYIKILRLRITEAEKEKQEEEKR